MSCKQFVLFLSMEGGVTILDSMVGGSCGIGVDIRGLICPLSDVDQTLSVASQGCARF